MYCTTILKRLYRLRVKKGIQFSEKIGFVNILQRFNMATGGEIKSSTDDFEGRKHPCCSSCSDDGGYTAAGHYCVNCVMYFCGKCLKCHNKIPASKSHQVNDVENHDMITADDRTERDSFALQTPLKCLLHSDQCIDTYCKKHDDVCCKTCAHVKHRLCTTESIATSVKDFKCSVEGNETKLQLNSLINRLEQEMKNRTDNLNGIETKKLEHCENIDKYEEEIVAKIKELTDKARQEVRSRYEEHKMAIDCEVTAVKTTLTTAKEYVEKIKNLIDNDHQSFIELKSIKMGTRDAEALLHSLNTEWKERTIAFNIDKKFKETILQQTTMGQLGNGFLEYKASWLKFVKARLKGASCYADISCSVDMCSTVSGELLIADNSNHKLKRLDSNLQYRDMVKLPGEPAAICQVGVNEVAVRMRGSKEVQLVSVGESMQITSTFTLDGDGFGMMYDVGTEEIYACEDDIISVYDKTGNKLRTYDTDRNGKKIFSACRQVMMGENNQDIYVTDMNKGLIILDKNGSVKKVVKVRGVSKPWLLCQLPGQISLIGGENSGVIAQVDKYGKQLGNLIKNHHGGYCAAVYDQRNSRLIVGGKNYEILIYDITL